MRRDFTLNAIFYHLQKDEVEDFLGGRCLKDLADGVLNTPTPDARQTLLDDPLRALRALRFSARFGFVLGEKLLAALRDPDVAEGLATKVSRPRIRIEIWKALLHVREEAVWHPDSVSTGRGKGLIQWLVDLGLAGVVFPCLQRPAWVQDALGEGSRLAQLYRRFRHSIRFDGSLASSDEDPGDCEIQDAFRHLLRSVRHDVISNHSSAAWDVLLAAAGEPTPALRSAYAESATDEQTVQELVCLYQRSLSDEFQETFGEAGVSGWLNNGATTKFVRSGCGASALLWVPHQLGNIIPKPVSRRWQSILVQQSVLLTSSQFQDFQKLGFAGVLASHLLCPQPSSPLPGLHTDLSAFEEEIVRTLLAVSFYTLAGPRLCLPAFLQGALIHHISRADSQALELEPSHVSGLLSRALERTLPAARAVLLHSKHLQKSETSSPLNLTQWIISESRLGASGRIIGLYADFMRLSLCSPATALQYLHAVVENNVVLLGPVSSPREQRIIQNSRAKLADHIKRFLLQAPESGSAERSPFSEEWLGVLEDVLEVFLPEAGNEG